MIQKSCGQFSVPENDADEIKAIKDGLVSVSKTSQVDSRYLLAIMMQESKGCVRAPTTNYGVRNPGLFQDFNGEASCNDGTVITPCPPATITKMIEEGAGVGMEVGLSIGIAATGVSDVSKYYKAARIYNSGSVDSSGNLGAGVATHCYVSDIANRLLGWVDGGSSCSESSIGTMTGSAPYAPSDSVDSTTPTATEISVASSTPTPSATMVASAVPETAAPVDATPATPVESDSPSSPFPGAASGCKSWYKVKAGDNCMSTGIDTATLAKLNTGLDSTCSNLWLGYSYCVSV
jgi:flagellin-like hook-associated protein FlgL